MARVAGCEWLNNKNQIVTRAFRLFCLVVLVCAAVTTARAQSETATISGFVTDEGGGTVPNCEVVLQSVERGTTATARTNEAGIYVFASVQPGQYNLTIKRGGFKQVDFLGLIVNVQDHIEQNFRLQVGSVSESVTVEAGGLNINTTDGSVSTVIDRNFVSQLPLNGRSFNTLLQLTPGVVIAPTSDFSPGQFSINGQRTNANYFTVDGVAANFGVNGNGVLGQSGAGGSQAFSALGGTSSLVSVDAVQEFRVQTSTFAAEYGRAPGGQVIIETRSGTNDIHGGVFDYFRNDVLDANDWFANSVPGEPHAPERQNDFGAFLGSPIIKNKTFLFLSYEGLRLRQPQSQVIFVPSLSARASAIASAAPYLNAYPKPNGTDFGNGTAQFTGTYSNQAVMDAGSARIDHHFGNGKWSIFGRYNYAPSSLLQRQGSLNELSTTNADTTTITGGLIAQLTPGISNSFRGNYSIQSAGTAYGLDAFGGATVPSTNLLLPSPLSPTNAFGGFSTADTSMYQLGQNSKNRESQVNLLDDFAISVHSHQLKFGFDYRQLNLKQAGFAGDLLYAAFTAQGFASSGMADFFIFNAVQHPAKIRFHGVSLYGQDRWTIGQRLTLTFGVRWEFDPAPYGYDGTALAAWANVDSPASTILAPPGTSLWTSTYGNFAPRFGAAYRLTQKGDFVLRGGWGIFYDSGTSTVPSLAGVFPNTGTFITQQPTALPLASATSVTPTTSTQPPYGSMFSTILGFSPNLQLPRSYQWNLAVEKSFLEKNVLSITYLGQVGRKLIRVENEPQPNANFPSQSFFQIVGNRDTSDYHALQAQFRRPLSRRVQALLNYAWSHSIDTSSSDATVAVFHGALSPSSDRGSSSFDVRQSFSGALTYDLPGVRSSRIVRALTSDWSLDTVVVARTGFPIDVTTQSVTIPGLVPGTSTRPDRVPGAPFWLYGSQYPGGKSLNPAAFDVTAPQAANRQGTLGRDAITGFGFTQVDLSVARKFVFTERIGLQFRADLFNVLNHPNFSNPDARIDNMSFASTQMLNRGLGGLSPLYQEGGPRSVQLSLKLQF